MPTKTLEELLVQINASTDKLRSELAEGDRSVKKFGKGVDASLGNVDNRFASLTRSVKGFIGAFGVALGIGAIARESAQALRALEEVGRQADSLGSSVESIQELTLTFREFDLGSNDVSDALGTVADRAQDAKDGMKSFIDDFKLLGISVDDLRGKRPEELFALIADRVAEVEDPTQRTAGIVRIFGDDLGRRLNPLLIQGSERLEEYAARWRELGAIVDEGGVRAAGEAAEKFRELQTSLGGRFTQVVADNADNISLLADALIDAADAALTFSANVTGALTGASPIPFQQELTQAERRIAALRKEMADLQITNLTGGGSPQLDAVAREIAAQEALIEELKEKQKEGLGLIGGGDSAPAEESAKEAGKRVGNAWLEGFKESARQIDFNLPELERLTADRLTPRLTADQVFPTRDIIDGVFQEIEDKAEETTAVIDEDFNNLTLSIGRSVHGAFSDALRGVETSFADLLARMAADLIASELLKILGGLIPGPVGKAVSAGLPGFASGGRFQAGRPFAAGERGTEIILPDVSGRVMTASQTERMMRGGGGGVVVNIQNAPAQPQMRERMQGGVRIVDVVFPSIMDDLGKNGPLTQAIGARFGLNPAFSQR